MLGAPAARCTSATLAAVAAASTWVAAAAVGCTWVAAACTWAAVVMAAECTWAVAAATAVADTEEEEEAMEGGMAATIKR